MKTKHLEEREISLLLSMLSAAWEELDVVITYGDDDSSAIRCKLNTITDLIRKLREE